MIGEVVAGEPIKEGQIAKQHYAYEKKGSCSLLCSIEPLTGKRIASVFDRRRKMEFALHFQQLAAEFPDIRKLKNQSIRRRFLLFYGEFDYLSVFIFYRYRQY